MVGVFSIYNTILRFSYSDDNPFKVITRGENSILQKRGWVFQGKIFDRIINVLLINCVYIHSLFTVL